MAKPLPAADPRGAGALLRAPSSGIPKEARKPLEEAPRPAPSNNETLLKAENEQLRALCAELELALQEAGQQGDPSYEDRLREYEAMLEEKNEALRQLQQELQDAQAVIAELEAEKGSSPRATGPTPREEELLNLSEELEHERRQLQEDEQSLMGQMRDMEMTMARERAEMARQRNDLQRIQGEVRHELERLEKHGALQSKIDGLKNKLQDVSSRRGMASSPGAPAKQPAPTPPSKTPIPEKPKRDGSLFGRFFGGGSS